MTCQRCEEAAKVCESIKIADDPYAPQLIRAAREIRSSCRHSDPDAEAMREDAERYRWLKDEERIMFKPAGYDGFPHARWDMMWLTSNNDLDAAIDAARKEGK